jgi:hypothetical protein
VSLSDLPTVSSAMVASDRGSAGDASPDVGASQDGAVSNASDVISGTHFGFGTGLGLNTDSGLDLVGFVSQTPRSTCSYSSQAHADCGSGSRVSDVSESGRTSLDSHRLSPPSGVGLNRDSTVVAPPSSPVGKVLGTGQQACFPLEMLQDIQSRLKGLEDAVRDLTARLEKSTE